MRIRDLSPQVLQILLEIFYLFLCLLKFLLFLDDFLLKISFSFMIALSLFLELLL